MASSGQVDLAARARDPGFTPGLRDLEGLLEIVRDGSEEDARAAIRAALRLDARHGRRVAERTVALAREATRPGRGRLTDLVGRLAAATPSPEGQATCRAFLLEVLSDADPKTRRNAARGLGKQPRTDETERALLDAWDAAPTDDDRRALADALGRIGSAAARERLAGAVGASASLERSATRATLMIERTGARERGATIALARAPDRPTRVRLHARAGLEPLVVEELGAALEPAVVGEGLVDATLSGPLSEMTSVRTALHVGFPLAPVPAQGELGDAIADALLARPALELLRAFTETDGPIRFRLAFLRGGHRRAVTWRCAERIRRSGTELVNDPTASTWEVVVDDHDGVIELELVPRAYEDARFAYRGQVVPASSHPTIAAALARAAPRAAADVVWDPFVGAGVELVERARLGPYGALLGTDLDANAARAARANLSAAGVERARVEVADALAFEPGRVDVILSNPPMGRRVQRGTHGALLARFVERAARLLAPGGALVWIVPEPRRVRRAAEAAGLRVARSLTIDMGGFTAELHVLRKPGRR